jgi:hypothetical protein
VRTMRMGRHSTGSPVTKELSEFQFPSNVDGGTTVTAVQDAPPQVQTFLDENAFLMPLLPEIRRKLRDYFPDSPVSLTVACDPDETDRLQLVVAVATNLSPGDAINRFGEFDRDWWLDNLDRSQGRVCIDFEYR